MAGKWDWESRTSVSHCHGTSAKSNVKSKIGVLILMSLLFLLPKNNFPFNVYLPFGLCFRLPKPILKQGERYVPTVGALGVEAGGSGVQSHP